MRPVRTDDHEHDQSLGQSCRLAIGSSIGRTPRDYDVMKLTSMILRFSAFAPFAVALLLASGSPGAQPGTEEPPSSHPPRYDFQEILFEAGEPRTLQAGLLQALIDESTAFDALHRLEIYTSYLDSLRFGVVGFADEKECAAARCLILSESRARLLYEFLLSNGIPPRRLVGWIGKGAADPLDTSESEEHSRRNRRVEIRAFDPDTPGYERWDD